MKFSKHLESAIVPEWRKAYIDYKELKKDLSQVEKFRKSKETKAASDLDRYLQALDRTWKNPFHYFDRFNFRPGSIRTNKANLPILDEVLFHAGSVERNFFDSLDFELEKIAKFYKEKETDAQLKLNAIKIQLYYLSELARQLWDVEPSLAMDENQTWFKYQDQYFSLAPSQERISHNVAKSRLNKVIREYYKSLMFLKSFKELNQLGFRKILKKFDKVAGWNAGPLYLKMLEQQHWVSSTDLEHIMHETETLFINEFADGHRSRGMRKLRPSEQTKDSNFTVLRVGIFLGLSLCLLIQAAALETTCLMSQSWVSPLLAALPPWWRLLQCLRRFKDSNEKVHLLNAAKYATSILVALITGIKRMYPSQGMSILWIAFCLINSCYTCIWDLKKDWGLIVFGSKHLFLRDEIVFYQWTYYIAIVSNISLRFTWALGLLKSGLNGQSFGILIAALEAYRRIQWNFFRLENEHLNNCGQYRAIKEIPLPYSLLENKSSINAVTSSHRPSYYTIRQSCNQGSFYGRRDFETKQDPEASAEDLHENSSALGTVLTHIKSLRNSESEEEDD
ncbi:EXS family-domain-containing protein [Sporodiniella umbellata]|nr:EXS family-domain-containing protein [Sporodiniella umbellata]